MLAARQSPQLSSASNTIGRNTARLLPRSSKLRSENADWAQAPPERASSALNGVRDAHEDRPSSRTSARRRRADVQEYSGSSGGRSGEDAGGTAGRNALYQSSSSSGTGSRLARGHRSSSLSTATGAGYDAQVDGYPVDFPQRRSPLRSTIPLEFRQPTGPAPREHTSTPMTGEERSRTSSQASYPSPRIGASPLIPRTDSLGDSVDHSTAGSSRRSSSSIGRNRRPSDPHTGRIPEFDYEGRGGSRWSRLSVDSSSARRHLAQASLASAGLPPRSDESPGETFAEMRARKTSGSSSISQRSGGSDGASRLAPRRLGSKTSGSMRHDVFAGNGEIPPVPSTAQYRSPKTSLSSTSSERLEELRARKEALRSSSGLQQSTPLRMDVSGSAYTLTRMLANLSFACTATWKSIGRNRWNRIAAQLSCPFFLRRTGRLGLASHWLSESFHSPWRPRLALDAQRPSHFARRGRDSTSEKHDFAWHGGSRTTDSRSLQHLAHALFIRPLCPRFWTWVDLASRLGYAHVRPRKSCVTLS